MNDETVAPESTAVRVALWRALHLRVDAPPHVFDDYVGLELATPEGNWMSCPDMDPTFTKPFRASIVARARFIEDLVIEQSALGLTQYVILGAGLDSFAQRKTELAPHLQIFEVDLPGPQEWKRQRLNALGYGVPECHHLVPFRFEAGKSWLEALVREGFDSGKPAVVVSTGVSMYLTKEANATTLREASKLAPGSAFAMTFLLPLEFADPAVRPGLEMAEKGARNSGTPFISFFKPDEIVGLARDCGFAKAEHISADILAARYFANRIDDLCPPGNAEELLVATV